MVFYDISSAAGEEHVFGALRIVVLADLAKKNMFWLESRCFFWYFFIPFFLLLGSSAFAEESAITPYLKIYPEFKVESFDRPSRMGSVVGTLGAQRNDSVVLNQDVAQRPGTSEWVWSNSYVGLRGDHRSRGHQFGFDLQYEIDFQGSASHLENMKNNLQTRDAYLFYERREWGRLQMGKFDSIYKDWGDRYPMLGLTSGNFIANSRVLSQAGWRGGGSTSFNNRRSHSLLYVTPSVGSVKMGIMYSHDAGVNDPGGPGTKLSALGVRWDGHELYAALLVENHMDWLPMSAGSNPGATSIRNHGTQTTSRDVGHRLALGWTPKDFRIGLDFSRLSYHERGRAGEIGRFKMHENETVQLTVQYLGIEKLRLALNATYANAGRCELTGGVPCFTEGLGGRQVSAGLLYSHSRLFSVFVLVTRLSNNPGARYGATPQGADALIYAAGVKLEQR